MPHHDLTDPYFSRNIGLSLSHLAPKILGPKFDIIFYQNILTVFKHFVSIFSLILDPIDPLYH